MLRPKLYTLSIAPAGPDDNTSGDLNATGAAPLTITGSGPGATVIDAGGLGDPALWSRVTQGSRCVGRGSRAGIHPPLSRARPGPRA